MSSCEITQNGLSEDINFCRVYKMLPLGEKSRWTSDFRDFYMKYRKQYSIFNNLHSSDVQRLFEHYLDNINDINNFQHRIANPLLLTVQLRDLVYSYLEYKYFKRFDYLLENHPEVFIKAM